MTDNFILKSCSNCAENKIIEMFPKRSNQCKMCYKEKREEVKKEKQEYDQNYRIENKTKKLLQDKHYYQNNKPKIKITKKEYVKQRRVNDPSFKLRQYVSKYIRTMMQKNNTSCLQFLPFSITQLKIHLEKQFEPWMAWQNWGRYNLKTWDDNNKLTWTWQLDHIVPQSSLPYTSMEDDNFYKSWALSNLRPLNAKQNLMDGVTKIRHNLDNKND